MSFDPNLCKRQPSQSPKASEAAHEATELVAKASEAAHAQHKDHVFIIRFAMIALGLSTMEASKTWTNSGNLRMPGCSSM